MRTIAKSVAVAAMMGVAIAPAASQVVATKTVQAGPVLPPNTPIYVSLNSDLTTKRTHEGDQFDVTVTRPVIANGYVVIPQGALGHGRIAWRTGKGAFGKSAKMEFDLTEIEVGGQTVPLRGHYRLEGKGNGAATVGVMAAGAVVGIGIVGVFVTGKSATAAQGTEYRGFTSAPVEFALAPADTQFAMAGPMPVNDHGADADPYLAGKRAAMLALAAAGGGEH